MSPRGVRVEGLGRPTIIATAFGISFLLSLMVWIIWMAYKPNEHIVAYQPLGEMKLVGIVNDGPEQFITYEDEEGYARWYRTVTILDGVRYISENPSLMYGEKKVMIRCRWIPNRYTNCKEFLGSADGDPEGYCQRYHLPVNKIRSLCGGF